MTLRDLILAADQSGPFMLGTLAALPAASFLVGRLHGAGRGGDDPWRRIYTALVYASCIPGMFSASLIAYSVLFTGDNLLDASVLVYFGPIVAMTLALWIMSSNVDFEQVPGFDKIGGLLGLLAISFIGALFAHRMRIFVVFAGSIWMLAGLAAGLFFVFRLSFRRLLGPGNPGRP